MRNLGYLPSRSYFNKYFAMKTADIIPFETSYIINYVPSGIATYTFRVIFHLSEPITYIVS